MSTIFLRLPAVKQITGLCRASIYRHVCLGTFPAPVQIGQRAVAWRQSDIDTWAASLTSRTYAKTGAAAA